MDLGIRKRAWYASMIGIGLLVLGLVSVNIIAQKIPVRIDVTEDSKFTLSAGTKKILSRIDRPITARLYFSRSAKDIPPFIKNYATRVEEILNEYGGYSKGFLSVEVIDPKPDTQDEEWAQKYGINSIPTPRGEPMYFGILWQSGAREFVIPYLDPRREEFLEYDLSSAVLGLGQKEKSKIGIMSSLPLDGNGTFQAGSSPNDGPWAIWRELSKSFQVVTVAPSAKDIDASIKTLLLVHPKDLMEETVYAIDQFLMGGGRLIVALDPMSRIDMQLNLRLDMTGGQLREYSSDLGKLLNAWEVQYDPKKVVGDPALATEINAGGAIFSYPFYVTLSSQNFTAKSVITSSLGRMMMAESGFFEPKSGSPYEFEPLIVSTKDGNTVPTEGALYMPPQEMMRGLKKGDKELFLAGIVRGKFKSAFSAKPKYEGNSTANDPSKSEKTHLSEALSETQIVLIADTDFISDDTSVDKFMFGSQTIVRPRNDNLNFILNAVDYLSGSDELVTIRSKGRSNRPFTRVLELQKNAQFRWQAEEERLTQELTDLQKRLNEMQAKRTDNNRFTLSSAQQDEIAKFREEERKIRVKRREVRKNLREDIESLGRRLVAINMLGMPSLASVFGIWVFMRRSRRRHGGFDHVQ